MAIEYVNIAGVRATESTLGFELTWKDDEDFFGQINFVQDLSTGIVHVNSEHMSKAFVLSVLHTFGENAEVKDR